MGTPTAIRDQMKTLLADATGVHAYDDWPDTLNVPAVVVRPLRFVYTAMGNASASGEYDFEVHVIVQLGTLKAAQENLDAYLAQSGAKSVAATLYDDRTLGGEADDLAVLGWRDYGVAEVNGVPYLGATLDVKVLV